MRKNIFKYLAMLVATVCFGSATIAQQKASERNLSAEIDRIKEMQNRRNVLVSHTRQFPHSGKSKDAGNPVIINKPGKPFSTNNTPSRQHLNVPARRDIVVPRH